MATITIPFTEYSGSPPNLRKANDGSFAATRILRVRWAFSQRLMDQLLGYTAGIYTTPATYPATDDVFVVSVTRAPEGERIDAYGPPNVYDWAQLTVDYSTLNIQDVGGGVWAEESFAPAAEFLTRQRTDLAWDAAGQQPLGVDESPGFISRMLEWTIVQRNMSSVNADLNDYMGYVNSKEISSYATGRAFPAGTVLFNGAGQTQQYTEDGASAWTTAWVFMARPHSWNLFYRTSIADTPQKIYDANGDWWQPYPSIDFKNDLGAAVDS